MKELNYDVIAETKNAVLRQGEPQPVLCFEHRLGNLRGILAYLSNSVDTMEERRAEEYGAVDANIDGFLRMFRAEVAAAQDDLVELNKVGRPNPRLLLHLRQDGNGQWFYRITLDACERVPWQYGHFDRAEAIEQARSRFGSDLQVEP